MSAITERLRAAQERWAQRGAERDATKTERAQRKAQSDAIRRGTRCTEAASAATVQAVPASSP